MDGGEPVAIGEFVQSLRNRLRSDERNRNCLVRGEIRQWKACLLYTSPSPRDMRRSRMPSSA